MVKFSLFSMLFSPKKTIRDVIDKGSKKSFYFLASMSIMNLVLWDGLKIFKEPNPAFYWSFICMLILSPFLGAVQFYIQAWLLRFTGKWIKGKASTSDLKLVCAWSFAPVVFVIFPSLFLVMIFPKIFFHLELYPIITLILSLELMVTWFWSFILLIAGIAKVQNFSIARALVNAFLPLLALIGFAILLGIAVFLVSSVMNFFSHGKI